MKITEYGYKGEVAKYENSGKEVARIITTYKERYEIICNKGNGFAKIKRGCFYDNPNSIYPTTGDFVLLEWNDMGDSMITETLKRESYFSRVASSSDKNHEPDSWRPETCINSEFQVSYFKVLCQMLGWYCLQKQLPPYFFLYWSITCKNLLNFFKLIDNISFKAYNISYKIYKGGTSTCLK